ncbi:MAG: type IV secretion system DNA-binding domain-containing protein [Candidatus Competibacteraceae bacterium]|nr:type IV secretion system DNA-binding domain-containing protein [Candidatus Competibacteraceae bacterium]
MMTPLPSQPSNPQTAWIYLVASFLWVYGTLLYFYAQYVWPLGGFVNGVGKHAGYYGQGLRAVFIHDPISAQVWQLYVQFMTRQELWIPFLLRAFGGFVLLPFAVGWFLSLFSFKQPTEIHIRGLRYEPDVKKGVALAQQQIRESTRNPRRKGEEFKIHPQIAVPPALTNTGVLVLGSTGSGKTNFLLPLLQQIVASPHRSLILDVKGDFTEKLRYPNDSFIFVAPWDRRGWRWEIAKDVTSLSQARLFAESCIPASDEPIWSTGARQIFAGLMNYLCLTRPGQWDLLDFIEMTRWPDEDLIQIVHEGNPDAERVIANLKKENRTGQSILINLSTFIGPLSDMAWAWRQSPNAATFSVNEWLADDTTLPKGILLQSRRRFGELSEALTNALVTLLTDRMVDTAFPEADTRKTDWRLYVVLDEIAQSRKIEALQSLSSAGRSKGLHLVVGLQSITQLKKIYGPEFADLLYTNLLCRYIGRTPDGDSAEWIAQKLGMREVERLADNVSFTAAQQGPSEQRSWAWRREQMKVLMPSQLSSELGPEFKKNRIRGLLSVAGGSHVVRLAWPKVHDKSVRPALLESAWVSGKADPAAESAPESAPENTPESFAEAMWRVVMERKPE